MVYMGRIIFEVVTGAEHESLTIDLYANFVERVDMFFRSVIVALISLFMESVIHHKNQEILLVILAFLVTAPLLVTCKLW